MQNLNFKNQVLLNKLNNGQAMGVKLVQRETTTLAQRSTRGSVVPLSSKGNIAAQKRYISNMDGQMGSDFVKCSLSKEVISHNGSLKRGVIV